MLDDVVKIMMIVCWALILVLMEEIDCVDRTGEDNQIMSYSTPKRLAFLSELTFI